MQLAGYWWFAKIMAPGHYCSAECELAEGLMPNYFDICPSWRSSGSATDNIGKSIIHIRVVTGCFAMNAVGLASLCAHSGTGP